MPRCVRIDVRFGGVDCVNETGDGGVDAGRARRRRTLHDRWPPIRDGQAPSSRHVGERELQLAAKMLRGSDGPGRTLVRAEA